MVETLAAALLLVVVSAALGQALCTLCGWRRTWIAPAVGLAVLLAAGGAAQYVPGHADTVAVAIVVLFVVALAPRLVRTDLRAMLPEAVPLTVGVGLLAALPLFVSGARASSAPATRTTWSST